MSSSFCGRGLIKRHYDGQQESNQAELIDITEALRAAQEEAVLKDQHWK